MSKCNFWLLFCNISVSESVGVAVRVVVVVWWWWWWCCGATTTTLSPPEWWCDGGKITVIFFLPFGQVQFEPINMVMTNDEYQDSCMMADSLPSRAGHGGASRFLEINCWFIFMKMLMSFMVVLRITTKPTSLLLFGRKYCQFTGAYLHCFNAT